MGTGVFQRNILPLEEGLEKCVLSDQILLALGSWGRETELVHDQA